MDPTIDRAKIHLTMNVDAQGNPSGGGGGGGGDASAANQVTGNNSLSSIDTKVATETTLADAVTALEAIQAKAEDTAPVLVTRAPYREARQVTPGTNVDPGQGVLIVCTVAGTQNLELDGGDVIQIAVAVGTSFIDNLAVIDAPTGGTATCVVTVLGIN